MLPRDVNANYSRRRTEQRKDSCCRYPFNYLDGLIVFFVLHPKRLQFPCVVLDVLVNLHVQVLICLVEFFNQSYYVGFHPIQLFDYHFRQLLIFHRETPLGTHVSL